MTIKSACQIRKRQNRKMEKTLLLFCAVHICTALLYEGEL